MSCNSLFCLFCHLQEPTVLPEIPGMGSSAPQSLARRAPALLGLPHLHGSASLPCCSPALPDAFSKNKTEKLCHLLFIPLITPGWGCSLPDAIKTPMALTAGRAAPRDTLQTIYSHRDVPALGASLAQCGFPFLFKSGSCFTTLNQL